MLELNPIRPNSPPFPSTEKTGNILGHQITKVKTPIHGAEHLHTIPSPIQHNVEEIGAKIMSQAMPSEVKTSCLNSRIDLAELYRVKAKEVCITIYKLSTALDMLKQEELAKTDFVKPEGMLSKIQTSLLEVDHHKEMLFEARHRSMDDQKRLIFKSLQDLVGAECFIPVNFRVALAEYMMCAEEDQSNDILIGLKEYLRRAAEMKKYTLEFLADVDRQKSAKKSEGNLMSVFKECVADRAENLFMTSYKKDPIVASTLLTSLHIFNVWVLAKVGAAYNTQPVTDAIELALETDTKETKREVAAIGAEKKLASYLSPEDGKLAEKGFRTHEMYGLKVKNEWNLKHNESGLMIEWTGTFATQKIDKSYDMKVFKGLIDLSNMILNSDSYPVALKFVQQYCQSTKQNQENLKDSVHEVKAFPKFCRPALCENKNFWAWVDAGMRSKESQEAEYMDNIVQVQSSMQELVGASQKFADDIDRAMVGVFVDETQDLENVDAYDPLVEEYDVICTRELSL